MALGITHLTHLVEKLQADMTALLCLVERMETQMPTRADLDAAKAQLQQGITDAANRVATDIQALRDQVANGQPITDQDLADLQADVQAVANIDAAPTPAPGPAPGP